MSRLEYLTAGYRRTRGAARLNATAAGRPVNRDDRDEAQQRPHDAKDWSAAAVLVDQTTLPTADELREPLRVLPKLPAGAWPRQRSSRISRKSVRKIDA